jgi:hypothetical protein
MSLSEDLRRNIDTAVNSDPPAAPSPHLEHSEVQHIAPTGLFGCVGSVNAQCQLRRSGPRTRLRKASRYVG